MRIIEFTKESYREVVVARSDDGFKLFTQDRFSYSLNEDGSWNK